MKFRTVYVPLIILVVLIAFVIFFERKKPTEEEIAELEKLVFAVSTDEVDVLKLTGRETVALEKFGEEWRMVEPVETGADVSAIQSILRKFELMRADRVLEEGISDPSEYGLSPPAATIELASHGMAYSLEVGELNATETSYFARVTGDNRLLLLPKQDVDVFIGKTPYDLRDKRVFTFSEPSVAGFTVTTDEAVTIEPDEDGWMMIEPTSTQADKPGVEGLLRTARTLRASEFINHPGDLSDYGLDKPRVRLEINLGDTSQVLVLGDSTVANTVYGKTSLSSSVFTVPGHLADGIAKGALDLKDKTIFNFDRTLVVGFVVDGLGASYAARKMDDESWVNPITGDTLAVEEFSSVLARLYNLRAMSFEQGEWNDLAVESTRISVSIEVLSGPVPILVMGKSDSHAYGRLRNRREISRIPLGVYEAVKGLLPES